ncbi:cytochrome b/b6 domain-containing protein [Pelotomaculum propionicicum]|uniref:cytochrome b/b6 domain-containing protein n=1 Tax=Pelotomaculum propionicicum TaxID=258475 RepID=UPI003B7C0CD1
MSRKTITKLALDTAMAVLFIILIFAYDTGLAFHEIAGLAIFTLFTVHIFLNWTWVKSVTKNLFTSKIKKKPKLMYVLNTVLLFSVGAIIVTGIMISRVVFDFGLNGDTRTLAAVHKWLAYACLGLFVVHIALNWRFVTASVQKIFHNYNGSRLRKSLQALGAAAMVMLVVYFAATPGPNKAAQQATVPKSPPREAAAINNSENKTTDDQNYTITNIQDDGESAVSLSEYLSNMFCTGCDKHCPLLSPQCKTGQSQLQAAKIQYEKLYG